jgi:flagellar basal body-associated protein FliL
MKNKTLLIIIISTIVVFIITAIVLTEVFINKAINNKQE